MEAAKEGLAQAKEGIKQNKIISLKEIAIENINKQAIENYLSFFKHLELEGYENQYQKKDSVLLTEPFCILEIENNNDTELKIDTYRASGAGGQHVNKTESAIRITHIPTNLVVTCQDESSQHKNRDKALKVLRSRLYELEIEKQHKERANVRKSMVSTGDRSAKIRTYNFPQGRVTDHRINLTLYKLNEILDGDLNEVIESLNLEEQKVAMEAF